ncbi:MAG: pyrimidine 5'-nucleotidase [Hyphomonadaceae bacterium]|jgi:putative hydrolase of the HAD superfamily|nr:pyrimidine 5'-nucleotidase [Hyphomonadaceae bacterium]
MTTRPLYRLRDAHTWVFDLDNTLYPAECDLFAQIDARMTEFVGNYLGLGPDEARAQQKHYYHTYGTTLSGMMKEHGMPASAFLDYVHDLDYTPVVPAPRMKAALQSLPGRKIVFTNGSVGHAERTLKALGLDEGVFSELFGIEETGYIPKPRREAFDALVDAHSFDPNDAVMVEDLSRNLVTAHAMGFSTVLVWSWKDWSHEPEGARPAGPTAETEDHVHHMTDDLTGFLEAVAAAS